ncbi:MAG TPA: DUF3551 domain-containing protein [Bradyrhizobium sp.]|jgi:hypothetical protein|nr:DUF3551 domain-containing protein [Bradyrhizobium sp.]
MKPTSKTLTASAVVLSTLVFGMMATPAANAGEYCSTNTSGMRGCGYSTLEQCQASISGTTATCARDPFINNESNASADRPMQTRSRNERHASKQSVEH